MAKKRIFFLVSEKDVLDLDIMFRIDGKDYSIVEVDIVENEDKGILLVDIESDKHRERIIIVASDEKESIECSNYEYQFIEGRVSGDHEDDGEYFMFDEDFVRLIIEVCSPDLSLHKEAISNMKLEEIGKIEWEDKRHSLIKEVVKEVLPSISSKKKGDKETDKGDKGSLKKT